MALNRFPQPSRTEAQIPAGDQQPCVVGAEARYGARLPHADEVLSSRDIAAILFPHLQYPRQAVSRWLRTNRVPTKTVGNSIRVTGASFLAAINDADKARRRQRTQLRRVG